MGVISHTPIRMGTDPGTVRLVDANGIEPKLPEKERGYSPHTIHTCLYIRCLVEVRGNDPRLLACKAGAWPIQHPQCLAAPLGFEPSVSEFRARRISQDASEH